MSETTLTEFMGHGSFETTHKFYVKITDQMKQQAMEKVFERGELA